jgi:hypothetical protein
LRQSYRERSGSRLSPSTPEARPVMASAANAGTSDRTKTRAGQGIDFINIDYRFDLFE